eukprot:GHVN01102621.1.p1 GENE.GHVN01102621.1~~GHVN01102621.1.p1  ORF type:complete len:125 (+),score=21.30 GHVN01102621.1:1-375(+)
MHQYQSVLQQEWDDVSRRADSIQEDEEMSSRMALPVTIEKVEKVIGSLPCGKAPGPDGLKYEHLKLGGVCVLCSPVLEGCQHLFKVYKGNGPKDEVESYQPVSLLSVIAIGGGEGDHQAVDRLH